MTSFNFIQEATSTLEKVSIPTARLDTLVLLEDATGKDRGWLLAHPEYELSPPTEQLLNSQILRRASHEPLAYIRGKCEFYGREFYVTMATLQPRAETETMIDLLKGLGVKAEGLVIADIGTGSGCLAITAQLEFPESQVYGTDISNETIEIAQKNAKKLKSYVTILQGNLLEPINATAVKPTVLLCNLPYVPDSYAINKPAMQEPKAAIFGGGDGLDLYRELFIQIEKDAQIGSQVSAKVQYILTESLPFQHEALAAIALSHGYSLNKTEDFIQVFTLDV